MNLIIIIKTFLVENGLKVAGFNPERNLVEIVEIEDHPYYVGCQFHPEFTSRPNRAQPLFQGLISAAHDRKYNNKKAISKDIVFLYKKEIVEAISKFLFLR